MTERFFFFYRQNAQTAAPKYFPYTGHWAIAKAPQNVTRAVARKTFAPPALAPMAPEERENTKTRRKRWEQDRQQAIPKS